MIAFVIWFALLVGLLKTTRGAARAILVILYLLGSIVVSL